MTGLDFAYVGAHFLWVLGLSMILAAFSYHSWRRQQNGNSFAQQLRSVSWLLSWTSGLALASISITVMPRSERWFVRLAGLLLAMAFVSYGGRGWWAARMDHPRRP